MQAVILDTNILLDVFVFEDQRALPLRAALFNQQLQAYTCTSALAELADVLSRPLFSLEDQRQREILEQWMAVSKNMEESKIMTAPWQCQDPDDQIFLNLAYTLRPAVLISKDNEVLKLANKATQAEIWITNDYQAFASEKVILRRRL